MELDVNLEPIQTTLFQFIFKVKSFEKKNNLCLRGSEKIGK